MPKHILHVVYRGVYDGKDIERTSEFDDADYKIGDRQELDIIRVSGERIEVLGTYAPGSWIRVYVEPTA